MAVLEWRWVFADCALVALTGLQAVKAEMKVVIQFRSLIRDGGDGLVRSW